MGQRLQFWVIADDLTGALDTAAPFAAHGWRSCVVPWPGRGPRAIGAAMRRAARTYDVVVIDTASRHVAAREAARRVRAVVTAARRVDATVATPRLFYKKIDSTLRGNVAAELAAFRAATAVPRLPLAPAFPAQGRTTRDGAVWVDGCPLADSPAAHDALDPAVSGDLARLAPPGALELFDAATDADLRRIATRLSRDQRLGAVAGSGGLAGAIAARFGARQRATAVRLASAAGAILVVSGSAHPSAHAQARALAAAGALGVVAPIAARTPSRDRRATEALALAALRAGRPVVLVCPPLGGIRTTTARATAAATRLAVVAKAMVTAGPVAAVFTVGGDTTAALATAMGWAPLAVEGHLEPGVAVVRLDRRVRRYGPAWLITKSGAFGDPQTLRRLVRRITMSSLNPVGHRSMITPPLAITMGDASGVGPEILLRAFASGELGLDVVAVGDLAVLELCNQRLHCGLILEPLAAPRGATPGHLGVLDHGALSEATLRIGQIDRASGAAALAYVERATRLALAGEAAAVVTLPINKAATRLSASTFTGHTEYVAELCGRTSSTLMLVSERAIVTHVSTHVSLREALDLAQPARILEVIVQTDEILRRLRPTRRIAVAGLNPHAGEGGAFGDEDASRLAPAIATARDRGLEVSGPHPPDTVFLDMVQGRVDAVVCMYHDQGHIPMKLLDFRGGVNVTLGLPIVRTSVDHGTAFDIAWQGIAFTDSLRDACAMARRLARR